MRPALGGALLVGAACGAATGRFVPWLLGAATLVWLLSLRGRPGPRLVVAIAILVRVPFLFSEFHGDDVHRYVWEGRIQIEGHSPYVHAPDDPALAHLRGEGHAEINHADLPTIYPPLAQLLFRAAAWSGLGEIGLRNLVVLLDLLVVGVVLLWLRSTGRPAHRAIVYAWSPVAVASAAAGHVDPLMLLFLAGACWAWERGRARTAAGLLGAAILSKLVAVLLVPWLLVRRPRSTLLVLAPVVVLGYLPYAGAGDPLGSLWTFGSEFAFNASLFSVAAWIAPEAARPVMAALLVAWVAAVCLAQPRIASAGVLVLAGLLALSPTVHLWYLTWFLVLLPGVGRRAWAVPLVAWAATVVLCGRSYSAQPFVEHRLLTAIEYAIPAMLAAWLLWRRWPRREALATPRAGRVPSFSVVLPSRGEVLNLREILPRWTATGAQRVIVADTPTGDGTRELADSLPRVRYVPVAERGYGAAVAAGLAAAEGEIAVISDADHHLGPQQVEALLQPFDDPAVGLVSAARTDARALSAPQRFGNALATFLIAVGWGRRFHDLGPFRALRLQAWPRGALRDRGFGWNVEMNVRALERGMRVVEIGLPAAPRVHGRDRISGTLGGVVGAGAGILRQLYRLREQSCGQPSSS